MPSKSPAQARLMAAAAHTKGGFGGVPQLVGRDFNQADKGTDIMSKNTKSQPASYAAGGPVLQPSNSRFLKTYDEFREGSGKNDENWAKTGKGQQGKSKTTTLPTK